MNYSHANYHMHKATHDNEYVEWEEEWLIIKKKVIWKPVNQILIVEIIFITLNIDFAKYVEQRIGANG